MGGAFITIFGTGLKSQKLDISGVVDESEDQGENFKVWFTHTHEPDVYPDVICDVDRMFGLHVKPLIGQGRYTIFRDFFIHYLKIVLLDNVLCVQFISNKNVFF